MLTQRSKGRHAAIKDLACRGPGEEHRFTEDDLFRDSEVDRQTSKTASEVTDVQLSFTSIPLDAFAEQLHGQETPLSADTRRDMSSPHLNLGFKGRRATPRRARYRRPRN